jgi:hypothetical protein
MSDKPNSTPHIDPASDKGERERIEAMNLRNTCLGAALTDLRDIHSPFSAAEAIERSKAYEAYLRGDASAKPN